MSEERFRRPTPKWCTDTAIRLLRIGCRETDVLIDGEHLLPPEHGRLLVEAAAALDLYGQRVKEVRSAGRS